MKHIGAIKHFSTAISIFFIMSVFVIATAPAAFAQRDVTDPGTLAQRDTTRPAVQQQVTAPQQSAAAAQQTTTPQQSATAQQPTTLQKVLQSPYMPQFHGLLNARYEYEPRGGEKGESASSSSKPETEGISRFEIRHARVDMTGRVSPIFDYRIQVDFSDEGSIKPIDAYVHFTPFKGFELTAGQMRIPQLLMLTEVLLLSSLQTAPLLQSTAA